MALICTQQLLTTTFMLSNNIHYTNNTCKVVHLIMVLIEMNCCWGGHEGWMIMLNMLQQWKNFISKLSFTNCLLHLEGKEVFRFSKWLTDYPHGVDNDSHCSDCVNFSHPRGIVLATEPDIVDDVHMQQLPSSSNKLLPLLFQGGLELKESICGILNIAHPSLQFNVLHCKKPWRSNAKQRSTFANM